MDVSGNLNAALTIRVKTSGSTARSAAASGGFVDQTSEDAVGETGRHAIGPVGRKR